MIEEAIKVPVEALVHRQDHESVDRELQKSTRLICVEHRHWFQLHERGDARQIQVHQRSVAK